ncbi:MAG: dihydrofolate reductase [Actinobacteria bacterium HGW-Actinobacteria-6]|jgi:dihydrofolate reductase|nr:MAG: dihydrofolate reductase [Actinobacteria bacterium HGW-Actinobacteria-6]
MPEIIYFVAMSLDGYIATPDGGVGWLAPFEGGPEDYGYTGFYDSVDAILLGSRTYEQVLTFGEWPYAEKPSWVLSSREFEAAAPEIVVTGSSPSAVAEEMRARGIRRAWLVGGAAVASSFRNEGLITEYIVSVMPVVLGGGIPLFGLPGPRERLTLVSEERYDDGVVQLIYRSTEA